MKPVIHACFDSKEAVMQAVESLLRHGVSEEDITLILPHPQMTQALDNSVQADVRLEALADTDLVSSAVVLGGEEGLGVGFGLGLLAAMCIPGIGMIDGSGTLIASLVATGAAIGGLAGSIYGYLLKRNTPHNIAQSMAYHITSGGATISVTVADALSEEAIVRIVKSVGGRVITHADSEGV